MLLLQAVYQQVPIMHPTGFQLSMAAYWRRHFATICTTTPPFHIPPGAGILIHYLRYGAVFSGNKLSILTPWIKTCEFLSAQKMCGKSDHCPCKPAGGAESWFSPSRWLEAKVMSPSLTFHQHDVALRKWTTQAEKKKNVRHLSSTGGKSWGAWMSGCMCVFT